GAATFPSGSARAWRGPASRTRLRLSWPLMRLEGVRAEQVLDVPLDLRADVERRALQPLQLKAFPGGQQRVCRRSGVEPPRDHTKVLQQSDVRGDDAHRTLLTRSHISVGGMLRVHARPHSLGVELRDVTSAHALLGAPSHVCDRARLQTLGANVLVVELLQRSDEQVVLRGEVVEDRRLAHAGTVGHLGNRYLSMALLLDKGEGCPTELSAAAIGLGIGATL